MEKINTPLMALIEELKAEQLAFTKMNVPCKGIDIAIRKAESLLPKEREVIEEVHNDSIIEFIEALGMEAEIEPHRASDYYNQTFKNHE